MWTADTDRPSVRDEYVYACNTLFDRIFDIISGLFADISTPEMQQAITAYYDYYKVMKNMLVYDEAEEAYVYKDKSEIPYPGKRIVTVQDGIREYNYCLALFYETVTMVINETFGMSSFRSDIDNPLPGSSLEPTSDPMSIIPERTMQKIRSSSSIVDGVNILTDISYSMCNLYNINN